MPTLKLSQAVLFAICSLSAVEAHANPQGGRYNENTVSTLKFLYGPVAVTNTREDVLNNVLLRRVFTYDFGNQLYNITCPARSKVDCVFNFSGEVKTGWEKTRERTNSSTVSTDLNGEFAGIGSSIGTSFTNGASVGESNSDERTSSVSQSYTYSPGQRLKIYRVDSWAKYSGTFDWFDGGLLFTQNKFNNPWKVDFLYDSAIESVITPTNSRISSLNNSPTAVPGPLGILGVLSAFKFSRKLRHKARLLNR